MQENVGTIDRWARVFVGGTLVTAGLYGLTRRSAAPAALLTAGALMLESAVTRVCPINALLGVDTRRFDGAAGALTGERGAARGLAEPFPLARDDLGAVQRSPADA